MIIGVRTFDLNIPGCRSLKEKRFVVKSIRDKIRSRFNVSVAEVDYLDKWQRTAISIATINQNKSYVNGLLDKVLEVVENERRVVIIDIRTELL